jgi:hypothetical protein
MYKLDLFYFLFFKCEPKTIRIQNHLFQNDTSNEIRHFVNGNEDLSLVELLNYGAFFNESTNSLSSVQKPRITRLDNMIDTSI